MMNVLFVLFVCNLVEYAVGFAFQVRQPTYYVEPWYENQRPAYQDPRAQVSTRGYVIQFEKPDDSCNLPDGTFGSCLRLDSCPSILDNLNRGILPKICSFDGYIPVVCCHIDHTRTSENVREEPHCPPIPNWAYDNQNITGRKAFDMCLKYLEPVFPCTESPPGSGSYIRNQQGDCAAKSSFHVIVGGSRALQNEFPHMAALGYGDDLTTVSWNCGGSLISDEYVLTAGHCVYSRENGDVTYVRLGDDDITQALNLDTIYGVSKAITHPKYTPPQKYYDIALIKLDRRVKFRSNIRPACLNLDQNIQSPVIATGWGATEYLGDISNTLMQESPPPNDDQHVNEQHSESDQLGNRGLEDQRLEDQTITPHFEEIDHSMTSNNSPAPVSQRQRRRQLGSQINDAQMKIQQTFETLNNAILKKQDNEDDEFNLYGKLLGKKLRNYSSYERHLMMHEIDGLLLRKPPRRSSNFSSNSYSISSPGQDSTDSLRQSPVLMNIPKPWPSQSPVHISSSAAASYTHMPSQSPDQIIIPNRPSSATASYSLIPSQSPFYRPSSAAASYNPLPSQSPVPISIPNRPSSAAASYAPLPSQSPVPINITNNPPMPSNPPVSTTQSNQIYILSQETILPSINVLQHALSNAEIDEFDLV